MHNQTDQAITARRAMLRGMAAGGIGMLGLASAKPSTAWAQDAADADGAASGPVQAAPPVIALPTTGTIHYAASINDKMIPQLIECILYYGRNGISDIWLSLNTYGGSVEAAMTFFNLTRNLPFNLNTYVSGTVQSSGMILFLSGKRRMMSDKSYAMMHPVSTGGAIPATERDFENKQELLRALDTTYTRIMAETGHQSLDKIRQMMREESYLDARQCRAAGFASEIGDIALDPKAPFSTITDDRVNWSAIPVR